MAASGHSKNGMFSLYQSQSRLSQKVSASSSFCLSSTWADTALAATRVKTRQSRGAGTEREFWFSRTLGDVEHRSPKAGSDFAISAPDVPTRKISSGSG